jgi:DNA-binding transcriptional LysR family regulator
VIDDGAGQRVATVAGAGISVNSLWNIHTELRSGALMRVLPDWTAADHSALWLVYPKTTVMSAKVRALIDFLIGRIGKAPPWRLAE